MEEELRTHRQTVTPPPKTTVDYTPPEPAQTKYQYPYETGYSPNAQQTKTNAGQSSPYTPVPKKEKKRKIRKSDVPPEGMIAVREKSPVPFYTTGTVFFLWALVFPLIHWWQFLLLGAVSGFTYFLSSKLFYGVIRFEPKPVSEEKKDEIPKVTGNEDADQVISDGKRYLEALKEANERITDPGISKKIDRMEEVAGKIFEFVASNPKKTMQIRKFMNYYLPTTLKLLNSYDRMSRQGVKGENISAAMFDIEGILHTIVTAFEKQLDALFMDEALDISADITVLEAMLQSEGLTAKEKMGGQKHE